MLFENLLGPTTPPVTKPPTTRLGLPPARSNPWTTLGKRFEPTTSADEALQRSGLNWNVSKVGLRTDDLQPVVGHYAIRRDDTSRILGLVGKDYQPLQNHQAFALMRDIAGRHAISFETAGSFGSGAIAWTLGYLPNLGIHIGDDESKTYLLISTGHTGNRPLTIAPTTIRVVCQNTLALALGQIKGRQRRGFSLSAGYSVRHTTNMLESIADIQQAYAATVASHATTVEAYQHLAAKPLTSKLERTFFDAVFGRAAPDESDRARAIRKSRDERLAAILASPTGQVKGTKNTAFSLFQSATEWIEHDRPTRSENDSDPVEQRLLSATWGSGSDLKATAWVAILELTRA